MTDQTPGVLLKGADGSHYFIPHTDLSKYAVGSTEDVGGTAPASAPRVHAFAVQRSAEEGIAAFQPMPEGDSDAAANMPTPEADAVAMPTPEDAVAMPTPED